jgi:hypothetical protein
MTGALLAVMAGMAALLAVVLVARWLEAQAWRATLRAYTLSWPHEVSADEVAAWLGHLVAATHAPALGLLASPPVGLEVVGTAGGIRHVLVVPERMEGAVLSALRAALPGVRLEPDPTYLRRRPAVRMAAEGRLTHLARPLAHERAERASAATLSAMALLRRGETVVLQWLFVGARTPAPATARSTPAEVLATILGEASSSDAEATRAARTKQAEPLLQAVVRLGIAAPEHARTYQLFGQVWGTLRGLNAPGVQVVRRHLPERTVVRRLEGMAVPLAAWPLLLNARELAGLLGVPLGGVMVPGLALGHARHLPPAVSMPERGAVVATSTYPGMDNRRLALKTDDRLRHSWVIGPTGTGKSTLLANLITADMQAGRGLAVVDPKGGDLIAEVLSRVPEERHDDVILIDPSRTERPVGINVLGAGQGEHAAELAVDHVVHLMHSLWSSSWGPRTSDLLRNALLTLTHARAADGSAFTLVELPELLLNNGFRRFVTRQARVPEAVRPFWSAFAAMGDGERAAVIAPSLNKLRSLTTRTALRLMLGQSRGVRLDEVFTKRRILLVALPSGIIGRETAALAGSLVMAGLWQATLARTAVPTERRQPAMLYLDEFQETMRLPLDVADMLAQARGLGVGLVLSHQYLRQLTDEVRAAVLGTVRTQIAFQVEHDDARELAKRFAPLTETELAGLGQYEIVMRPCVDGATLGPVTGRTLPLPEATTDGPALACRAQERFGIARSEVEAALRGRIEVPRRPVNVGRRRNGVGQ